MELQFIDSHCHIDRIDLTTFDSSVDNLVNQALNNGIKHMLCVSIGLSTWQKMADLVKPYEMISLSLGIHPSNVQDEIEPNIESFSPFLEDKRVIAIGETGLDYYYTTEHKLKQQAYFIAQIDIAKNIQKPIIVHTREARVDTIEILKAESADNAGGVLHCYTENWEMAKKGLDLGFYLSFSGIITFKNAIDLREIVKKTPIDRLLIETDAPYLAPVPYRGKINHPALVPNVAKTIAEVKNLSLQEVAKITSQNFINLFKIDL